MIRLFLDSRRSGFYLRVARMGELGAGDEVELLERDESAVSVTDVVELYAAKRVDRGLAQRALATPALPEGWREWLVERLDSSAPPPPSDT